MKTAFLSIGSNVGDKKKHLDMVAALLVENDIDVIAVSPFYETEPYGYKEQSWFYNQVIKIQTALSPRELLTLCQEMELQIGREKSFKWGPRVIDIDILSFEGEVVEEEDLKIPHPHLHMRQFVLQPLCDIDTTTVIDGLDKTSKDLLNECKDTSIVRRLS